jgi:TonB family protein
MPYLIWAPDPEYAGQNRINAVASLEVKVAPDGTVEAACLLDAPRADLAETAIQAVKTWRFEPASLNGQKVPAVAHLEIRFRACCAQTALLYPPPQLEIGQAKMLENGPCASWLRPVLPATTRPRAVYTPEPSYTDAARTMKVNGEVGLVLRIDRTGSVEGVCVAKSLPGDLDKAAARTIKTWRFEPAQRNGIAVPYVTYVTVSFKSY